MINTQYIFKKPINITSTLAVSSLFTILMINSQYTTNMQTLTNEGSVISDIGLFLWAVMIAVSFFTYSLLEANSNNQQIKKNFLLYAGILTSYILLDDFLQLHDWHFKKFNISEKFIYAVLSISMLVFLVKFKSLIIKTNYIILFFALLFLSVSIITDGILKPFEVVFGIISLLIFFSFLIFFIDKKIFLCALGSVLSIFLLIATYSYIHIKVDYPEYLFEEASKYIGIVFWTSYFINTSHQFLTTKLNFKS